MANLPLKIDIKNEREFKQMLAKGFPDSTRFAVSNAATRIVFHGMERSEEQIRDDFILRGSFVVGKSPGKGAVKYEKAIPHHDLSKIVASWGSVDKAGSKDYGFMEKQEEGFVNENKPVPNPKESRRGGSQAGKVLKAVYLKGAVIRRLSDFGSAIGSATVARVVRLRNAFKQGFGLPGSNQFFAMDDGEYAPAWSGGLFQFSGVEPPRNDLFYPNMRRLFYDPKGKSGEKRRRARHWMEKSANKITQGEIEKLYTEEFNKQLERNIKKMAK